MLTDTALAQMRPVTEADFNLFDAFHQQCSAENLLHRWCRTRLTPRDLTRLLAHAQCFIGLDVDGQPLGLVCIGPIHSEPGVVDLGLQVADAHQHHGIGTALVRHAACAARARGAHTLSAYTQATNTPMLRLLERLGPTCHLRDGPYVEARLALDQLRATPRTQEMV